MTAIPFFLFAFNSVYGFDQLEYLVIGRALTEGYPFFSFIPTKSVGIYAFVAAMIKGGIELNHVSLSLAIAAVYLSVVLATYLVTAAKFGAIAAALASALVAACAVFMELNFLEPEPFVYLCGLFGFWLITGALEKPTLWRLVAAGFVMGAGLHFKMVAAFYVVGLGLFFLWSLISRHGSRLDLVRIAPPFVVGFAIGVALPVAYFSASGRFPAWWEWTVYFPLLRYPPTTEYLVKFVTKLVWFHVALSATVALSLHPRLRATIYADRSVLLALLLAAGACAALSKTQASHYFFPAAAFFSIYMGVVVAHRIQFATASGTTPIWRYGAACVALAALALTAGLLYRPDALLRIVAVRSYDAEDRIARYIRASSEEGRPTLFVKNSALLYWVSGKYPVVPFVQSHVQTTYFLTNSPHALTDAIGDPGVTLVEFDPNSPGFDDRELTASSGVREELLRFTERLQRDFDRAQDSPPPFVFWRRKPTAALADTPCDWNGGVNAC
jgi:hypothetical protein